MNEGYDHFLRIEETLTAFRRHEEQKTGNVGDWRVTAEVAEMDVELGITRRRGVAGAALRLGYRLVRAYRYLRRGGVRYLADRIRDLSSGRN